MAKFSGQISTVLCYENNPLVRKVTDGELAGSLGSLDYSWSFETNDCGLDQKSGRLYLCLMSHLP